MRLTAIVPATDRPRTLGQCLAALERAHGAPDEVIVVSIGGGGPAAARNDAAARAQNELLLFVDADVVVHPDAIARVRGHFAADPELAAVMGSYDDTPGDPGIVSGFRNLLHHHVHQRSPGRAATFWSGLGAIRRDAFEAIGGFDAERYRRPCVEDIDLGLRLTAAGFAVRLDPEIQGCHLKVWTLRSMVRADVLYRGVPWISLLMRRRMLSRHLNLGPRYVASAALTLLAAAGVLRGRGHGAATAAATMIALNRRFYALLLRRRGPVEGALGVGLHVVHHLSAVVSVPLGVGAFLAERPLARLNERGAAGGRPSSARRPRPG